MLGTLVATASKIMIRETGKKNWNLMRTAQRGIHHWDYQHKLINKEASTKEVQTRDS